MARPLAEIIEEIENNLGPLKRRNAKREIEAQISRVKDETPYWQQFKRATAIPRQAKKARADLKALRASLPPSFSASLEAIDAVDPSLAFLEKLDAGARADGSRKALDKRKDVLGWRCALSAHVLMRELSKTEPRSSKDGPFRAIASLVFEAVTGSGGVDLKRACDSVMRFYKRM
jgi:hypothetical protein